MAEKPKTMQEAVAASRRGSLAPADETPTILFLTKEQAKAIKKRTGPSA